MQNRGILMGKMTVEKQKLFLTETGILTIPM